jgi:hypothetical protein
MVSKHIFGLCTDMRPREWLQLCQNVARVSPGCVKVRLRARQRERRCNVRLYGWYKRKVPVLALGTHWYDSPSTGQLGTRRSQVPSARTAGGRPLFEPVLSVPVWWTSTSGTGINRYTCTVDTLKPWLRVFGYQCVAEKPWFLVAI